MELSNKHTEQHGVEGDITRTTFPSGDQHVYINTAIDKVNDDHNYEQLQRNNSKRKGGAVFQQLKKRTVVVLVVVVILLGLAVIGLSVAFTITKKNDCGTPPLFKHGVIKDLTTTHFNSTFVIECNEGFTASSNNLVVCDSNGQWTTIPTCNPVVCGTIIPPENGHIIFINGTAFGDIATIDCNDGYTLYGSRSVACLGSSQWSDLPACLWTVNISDCYDVQHAGQVTSDGVYHVMLWKSKRTIQVFCDLTTDGGGWTVFQNRYDGSVDFYRNFANYTSGFGNLDGEFWLGLDIVHEMTSKRLTELRIDLTAADGRKGYEVYKNFSISEGPGYVLNNLPGTGTLETSTWNLTYHTGQSFTTYDHDNDSYSENCASLCRGAWWYKSCYYYNLNGRYLSPGTEDATSMNFYPFTGGSSLSLRSSRMMFRVQQ